MKTRLFQIYYNSETRSYLDHGFRPLSNMTNERPDWYEFWVIRKFLLENNLKENCWYGFLSPKFGSKTGLSSQNVKEFLAQIDDMADVGLISYAWDQIAYFRNPFEQGEFWHPGIFELSQALFHLIDPKIDLNDIVSHSCNFTFSNYIFAKANYWREWLSIANTIFEIIENNESDFGKKLRGSTSYGSVNNLAPIKTFIQERMPAVIFHNHNYQVATLNTSNQYPIFDRVFNVNQHTRSLLQRADSLKQNYCQKKDPEFLRLYYEARSMISLVQN